MPSDTSSNFGYAHHILVLRASVESMLTLISPRDYYQACWAVHLLARGTEGKRRMVDEEMHKIICRVVDYPVRACLCIMCACIRVCVYTCVSACMRACIRVCVRARAYLCVCVLSLIHIPSPRD